MTQEDSDKGYMAPGDITTQFGENILPGLKEIPRVHNISKSEFLREYVARRRPVVMTGVMDQWEMNRWADLDYMRSKIGEKQVQPRIRGGRELLANTKGMTFSQFLEEAPERDLYLSLAVLMKPTYNSFNRYFVRNSHPAYLPELASDFEIPFIDRKDIWEVNLWIGPGKSETPMHRDQMENLYFQVRGQKRFLLFPMSNNPGFEEDARDKDGRIAYEGYEILVNPGETLYFPSFWFHRVLGDLEWGISCNMWFLRNWRDLAAFMRNIPLDHIPPKDLKVLRRKLIWGRLVHNLKARLKMLPDLPPVQVGPASFAKMKSKEVQ